ncbi:MAG TPA: hypothetical protein DC006_06085 [Prevotellaceae bacterium]|nr:hypothetical protein [Prevotellaceae bacterium]
MFLVNGFCAYEIERECPRFSSPFRLMPDHINFHGRSSLDYKNVIYTQISLHTSTDGSLLIAVDIAQDTDRNLRTHT